MPDFSKLQGWIPTKPKDFEGYMATLPTPYFSEAHPLLKDSGKGKTVLLYEFVRKVYGKDIAQIQEIGDCVSFGYAHGADYLQCAEICAGDFEEFTELTATEYIYGTSRVLIGNGRLGASQGSYGEWARKAIMQYGVITRKKYAGNIDLTVYDGQRANSYGYYGPPNNLVDIGRKYPIKTTSLAKTWEEVRDAVCNGYPVPICCSYIPRSTRDKDGFGYLDQPGGHCQCVIGIKDDNRPGVCILNSWGRFMNGPVGLDCPQEAYWIDAEVLEKRVLSEGDSFVISDRVGFPKKELNLRIV